MNQGTNSIHQFGMFQGEGMFFLIQSSHIITKPLVPLRISCRKMARTVVRSSGRIGVDQTPVLGGLESASGMV